MRPQTPEPPILFPSAPSMPRDDDEGCEPLVNAQTGSPRSLAELCTAAIETYRKVAAIPRRMNPAGAERNARRHAKYV
jgi:hypothetical protein